jgi:hypothetical protein
MAAGDKRVSRRAQISIADRVSMAIAFISLLVSLSALGISWTVWKKPPPADPTIIPTFGESGKPKYINAGDGGRRFFEFPDKHPGRKIRILDTWILVGEGVDVQTKENEDTMLKIRRYCRECDIDVLIFEGKDTAGLSGLQETAPNISSLRDTLQIMAEFQRGRAWLRGQ